MDAARIQLGLLVPHRSYEWFYDLEAAVRTRGVEVAAIETAADMLYLIEGVRYIYHDTRDRIVMFANDPAREGSNRCIVYDQYSRTWWAIRTDCEPHTPYITKASCSSIQV